jgi:predicted dehydrogenase
LRAWRTTPEAFDGFAPTVEFALFRKNAGGHNRLELEGDVAVSRDFWIAARCHGRAEPAVTGGVIPWNLYAHTSPVYVRVDGRGIADPVDALRMLDILVSTPMPFHAPQSVAALQRGIHVLSEVPAATDLEQCWQLVQAVRSSRAKCMMAENCWYMKEGVLVRAMAQAGLFGELYYGEGGYVHELHDLNERTPWRRFWQTGIRGGTYLTHPLGPLLQWTRTRVVTVACMGSGHHVRDQQGKPFALDDNTIVSCKLDTGGMLVLRLDLLSPRTANLPYYSFALQGTKGCYQAPRCHGEKHRVWLKDQCLDRETWRSLWDFEGEFLPQAWRNPPEAALRAGQQGSDYFVANDFLGSILNDRKPPIDLYDALDMTLPGLVSQESIRRGSIPLKVPDFRAIEKFPDDLPAELQQSGVLRARQEV